MSETLFFVFIGLSIGAVYSLSAIGLVLTFKTSGVFNFAHGALATVTAYLLYTLQVSHHVPWWAAALIAIFVAGPVMGLLIEALARPLAKEGLTLRVAATIGLMIAIEGVIALIYGQSDTQQVPAFVSGTVHLLGTTAKWSDIVTLAVGVIVAVGLSVVLRVTRLGLAMRAVVDDADLLDTQGVSAVWVRRATWVVGATLAALSGVLFAPLLPLNPEQLTMLVIAAFGAAAIGRFHNLPLTFAGGLIVGILASLATHFLTSDLLAGIPPSVPFLVLFLVLLFQRPRSLPQILRDGTRQESGQWTSPVTFRITLGAVVLIGLAIVPSFARVHLTDWTTALATAIVFLSLSLLVRTSGQVSLSHVGFMAIGASAFSHFAAGLHLPWLLALILAGAIAMPIGAILSVPAIRLTGLYLALATFGFGILLQYIFYPQWYMFGSNGLALVEPEPHVLGLDSGTGFYYVVLVCVLAAVALFTLMDHGRIGRLLRGLGSSPTAIQVGGASINVTRVVVFCISAFFASAGGALAASSVQAVSASSYDPLISLTYVALLAMIRAGAPWNGIIASLAFIVIPSYVTGNTVTLALQVAFGAGVILTVLTPERFRHVPVSVRVALDRAFGGADRRLFPQRRSPETAGHEPLPSPSPAAQSPSLELRDLRVQFGGNVAVRNVSLVAPPAQITGLIGPNGAGKTTTFNACSGFVAPGAGKVLLGGSDVTRLPVAARGRLGIGRTFQQLNLFEALTVRQNVMLGAEARFAGVNPVTHLVASRRQRHTCAAGAASAMELCGLWEIADAPVASLSTGQRRLVDLARCLAGQPRVLLLDEPSSGLDVAESKNFAAILKKLVAVRGVGILLVEHDLSLVLGTCDSIYVLESGEVIFHGSPQETTRSEVVQAAYLGVSTGTDGLPEDEFVRRS